MAFIAPTLLDFITRYPEFRDFDRNWVQVVLDEAIDLVGEGWIQRYRRPAVLALAAHMLSTQPKSSSASVVSDISGGVTTGPIQSESVGPLTINYKRPTGNSGASEETSAGELDSTVYGAFYLQLRHMGIPAAILVV